MRLSVMKKQQLEEILRGLKESGRPAKNFPSSPTTTNFPSFLLSSSSYYSMEWAARGREEGVAPDGHESAAGRSELRAAGDPMGEVPPEEIPPGPLRRVRRLHSPYRRRAPPKMQLPWYHSTFSPPFLSLFGSTEKKKSEVIFMIGFRPVVAVADGLKAWEVLKEKHYCFDLVLTEVAMLGIGLLSNLCVVRKDNREEGIELEDGENGMVVEWCSNICLLLLYQ